MKIASVVRRVGKLRNERQTLKKQIEGVYFLFDTFDQGHLEVRHNMLRFKLHFQTFGVRL